jgi:hypothetical protein
MQSLNLFHRSDLLHEDAGTFFRYYYEDAERVFALLDSLCWVNQSLFAEASDAARLFFRTEIPPLHREPFLPIIVTEREYREGRKNTLVYGGTPTLRYGDDYYYGVPAALITGAVPLPETDGKIVDTDICTDLPVDPTVILLKDEDFVIRNDHIVFLRDVFDLLPSEGDAPNRTLTLWLSSVYTDRNYLQDRLGVLTQTQGESSPEYAAFVNTMLDSVIGGTGYAALTRILCLLFDVPCTETEETVEYEGVSASGHWQATDRHVYHAPLSASFIYSAGTTVPAGTILTDAITPIYGRNFPAGEPLLLSRLFLGREYIAGLIFPNEDVPITFDKKRLVFKIIGRNEDIRRFWDTIYARTADDTFLAEAAVQGMVNPAEFIYRNVLYPRARFYRIYADKSGGKRLPAVNTRIFRNLLQPGVLFDIVLFMPAGDAKLPLLLTGDCPAPLPAMPKVTVPITVFNSARTSLTQC